MLCFINSTVFRNLYCHIIGKEWGNCGKQGLFRSVAQQQHSVGLGHKRYGKFERT